MTELFLLGAGASVDAGLPDAYGMTEEMLERFRSSDCPDQQTRVANFVIGGLLFQAGIRGNNPLESGVNVEEFFSAVQLLAERNTLEAAPFVGSWHSMVEELDRETPSLQLQHFYEEISKRLKAEIIETLLKHPTSGVATNVNNILESEVQLSFADAQKGQQVDSLANDPLAQEFKKAVDSTQDAPAQGRIFQETADSMIKALSDIVFVKEVDRVNYLFPLIGLAKAQSRTAIATLNYDNTIELAAETQGIPCNTGIEEWSSTGSIDLRDEGLHLLKLHGSINWDLWEYTGTKERPLPHSTIRHVDGECLGERLGEWDFQPALIFGQRNKLTVEGPFLDLLRAFQRELDNCALLTVVGYSFRDDHVNTYISQWMNRSPDNVLCVLDPGFEDSKEEYAVRLRDLRTLRPGQVRVVQKKAKEGLLELCQPREGNALSV